MKKTKTAREFLIMKQVSAGVAPILCSNQSLPTTGLFYLWSRRKRTKCISISATLVLIYALKHKFEKNNNVFWAPEKKYQILAKREPWLVLLCSSLLGVCTGCKAPSNTGFSFPTSVPGPGVTCG